MDAFTSFLRSVVPVVDEALDRRMPAVTEVPQRLHEAMRYCVFAGGKRVRPVLVLMSGEALGAQRADLLQSAAAVELVHAFSLVHDDLPALDNDDLRRGRPTVHRRYDEATAILVGDALHTLAFEFLASDSKVSTIARLGNVADLARAVGSVGMIGGQVEDLAAEGNWSAATASETLERIHRRKTGALIACSVRIGARIAGASERQLELMSEVGEAIGLLFQIRDDLLDLEQEAAELGKTPGKDAAADKLTFPSLYGMEQARRMQDETYETARDLAQRTRLDTSLFDALLRFLVERTH